jgi:hypothetical protein
LSNHNGDPSNRRRKVLPTVALATTVALASAACSSSSSSVNPNRPNDLRYVTLSDWHIDPALRLTAAAGVVVVKGVASEIGLDQGFWSYVAVLGVSSTVVREAVQEGDSVVEVFSDPGGNIRVGTIPDAAVGVMDSDPRNRKISLLATLIGPGLVDLALGLERPDGKVSLIKTQQVGRAPIPIDQLASQFPFTVTAASRS